MDSAEILARELAELDRRLKALERGTQLTSSTIGTSAGTVSIVSGLEAGLSAGAAAAEALQKAASAEAKADGAVHTYFGDEAPELNVHIGDFWRRPDGVVFQFDGAEWVELSGTDPELAEEVTEALDRLAHAEEALDGKVTTYFLPARQEPPKPWAIGDLWVVSDMDNLTRRWDGVQWANLKVGWDALDENTTSRIESAEQDAATAIANAASAQATADGAVVTFFGSTEPTDIKDGAKDGDLWYTDGVLKQRVGSEWVRVDETTNSAIAGVQSGLTDALDRLEDTEAAIDGKVTTYVGPSAQLPQCTNFVSNGGFENGGVGWTTGQYYNYCAEAAYSGSGGVRITTSTTGNVYPRSSVWNEVVAGETLTMTAMCRVVDGTVAHNGTGVVVRYAFEDGTTGSWQVGRVSGGPTSPSSGWKKVQATHTVPANAVRAQAGFWISYTSAVAVMDWDDVVVTGSVVDISKLQIGDLWVVTDKNNLTRRWDGAVWADLKVGWEALDDATTARIDAASRDAATAISNAASAQAKADGAVVTFFGTDTPSGAKEGDFWYVGGILKQRVGTQWVRVDAETSAAIGGVQEGLSFVQAGLEDTNSAVDGMQTTVDGAMDDLADALGKLEESTAAIDGKITTFYMPSTSTPPNPSEGDLWVVSNSGNLIRRWNGTSWVNLTVGSGAIANNAITSTKISNNAVTAPKLEANLVLASRIIAGTESGNHAEMNSTGFHGFNGTREVMSLGVNGASDYMSFVKDDGTVAASLTQTGTLNANGVSAGSKLWYQGREFTDVTDDMPLGLLAISKRTTRGNVATGQNQYQPFMRIDATLLPGRLYKVTIGPSYTVLANGGVMGVAIYANYGQVGQIVNGTPTGTRIGYVKCRTNHDIITPLSVPFEIEGTAAQSVSFMFTYCNLAAAGQVTLQPDDAQPCPCYCMIEDLGVKYRTVAKGHAGAINLPNSNAVLPPQTPSVVDVQPSDRKNYYVSGNTATAVTVSGQSADTMYQGPWNDHGRRYMSAVRFADLPSLLTGVDVKGMMLCVNAKQWHYGNGGTVTLAPHGWNTLPSSFSISSLPTYRIESASFPNPGYRYIPIPSAIWNGFKTGTYRGFVFVGDESLDSTAMFGNAPEISSTYQLPFLQIGGASTTGSVA